MVQPPICIVPCTGHPWIAIEQATSAHQLRTKRNAAAVNVPSSFLAYLPYIHAALEYWSYSLNGVHSCCMLAWLRHRTTANSTLDILCAHHSIDICHMSCNVEIHSATILVDLFRTVLTTVLLFARQYLMKHEMESYRCVIIVVLSCK